MRPAMAAKTTDRVAAEMVEMAPGGAAAKLLQIIEKKGIEALAV